MHKVKALVKQSSKKRIAVVHGRSIQGMRATIMSRVRAALMLPLLFLPAFGGLRTVTSDVDSMPGAFRYMIDSASMGDTVTFDCPGTDTVKIQAPITLSRNIVVIGKNASMRGKIIIQCASYIQTSPFRVSGCKVIFKKLTITGFSGADSGGIFNVTGSSSTLILDSVSLVNSNAKCGGGIYINAGSVYADSCRIINTDGSGIYNKAGHCVVINSVFSRNSSSYEGNGGAIYNQGGSMELKNDSLSNNSADFYGGAIGLEGGTLILDHCIISGNSTTYGGGGGVYTYLGSIDATASAIVHNRAPKNKGGGIYIDNGFANFTGCDISNNCSFQSGGGIYVENGRLAIRGGSLKGDSATWVYDYKSLPAFTSSPSRITAGGCIFLNGGIVSIADALIADNRASIYAQYISNAGNDLAYWSYSTYGGAIYVSGGIVSISGCTFANNTSDTYASTGSSIVGLNAYSYGGCIYNDSGRVTVANSSIVNNTASSYAYTLKYNTQKEISLGSGVYNNTGSLVLLNATVAKNVNTGYGGCLYNESGKMVAVYGTITGNVKTDPSSSQGYALQNGGTCFLLNTILAGNTTGDYSSVSDSQSRSVNCLFGVGETRFAKNCSVGVTNLQLFGNTKPPLLDSGGPHPMISLRSFTSVAIGAGVRTGTYSTNIPVADTQVTLLNAAYFDSTISDWRALETDTRLSADIPIDEIKSDQRGKPRSYPPCVGAFELTAGDPVRGAHFAASPARSVSVCGRWLRYSSDRAADADLSLFTLPGRKIFSARMKIDRGNNVIALPKVPYGTLLCRIKVLRETVCAKFINAR